MGRGYKGIDKKELVIILVSGMVFLACCLFSQFRVSTYIAMVVFCIYFFRLALKRPDMYIKYLAYIFIMFAAVGGTMVIEFTSMYLIELETYSSFVGSLPLLLTSYWFLFVVFTFFERNQNIITIDSSNAQLPHGLGKIINVATILTIIIYGLMFLSVIKRPAFLVGLDRFYYASTYKTNRIISILKNQAGNLLLFPLLSIVYGKRRLGLISMGLYFFYFLWVGNKFGPFFTALCILCLIYHKKLIEKGRKYAKKILIIIGIVMLMLVGTTVIIASQTGSGGNSYLFNRLAMQGQEWWKTYDLCKGTVHPGDFMDEIEALFNVNKNVAGNVNTYHGIYRIMYLTTPKARVDFKLSTGALYTEAGFASAYYYFGALGNLIFAALMGIAIAKTINGFIRAFNNQDIIKMLILIRLFQLERTNLTMFLFNDALDVISIVSYLILIYSYGKSFTISTKGGRFIIKLR